MTKYTIYMSGNSGTRQYETNRLPLTRNQILDFSYNCDTISVIRNKDNKLMRQIEDIPGIGWYWTTI